MSAVEGIIQWAEYQRIRHEKSAELLGQVHRALCDSAEDGKFTCNEAQAIVGLYHLHDANDLAASFLDAHCWTDEADEGDNPEHLERKAALLAGTDEGDEGDDPEHLAISRRLVGALWIMAALVVAVLASLGFDPLGVLGMSQFVERSER